MAIYSSPPNQDMSHATGRMGRNDARFHHAAQNGARFKELINFLSCSFPFNSFGPRWQVIETTESKTLDKRRILHIILYTLQFHGKVFD